MRRASARINRIAPLVVSAVLVAAALVLGGMVRAIGNGNGGNASRATERPKVHG